MNINVVGVDVDGVLVDIESFQLKYGEKFFKRPAINKNGYGIKEMFQCSEKEEIDFWKKYSVKFSNLKIDDSIIEILKKLKSENKKIVIITSRAYTTEQNIKGIIMRYLLLKLLKKNKVVYDDLVLCPVENSAQYKASACKNHKVDIMIEDEKNNAIEISKNTKVIMIRTNNNLSTSGKNIYMANSFEESYMIIKKIESIYLKNVIEDTYFNLNNIRYEFQDYMNLPYNSNKNFKKEKQFLKVLKLILSIFNKYYSPINLNTEKYKKIPSGSIFVCNHLHSYDPVLILNQLNYPVNLLAKAELNEGILGILFRYIGSVFINENSIVSKKTAKMKLIKNVIHGHNIMIFPEGTRNRFNKAKISELYKVVNDNNLEYKKFEKSIVNQNILLSEAYLLIQVYKKNLITKNELISYLSDVRKSLNDLFLKDKITEQEILDSKLLPLQYGAVSIAKITGKPIIPFAVTDNYYKNSHPVTIVGEPIYVDKNDNLDESNKLLRKELTKLMLNIEEYNNKK